MERVVWHPDLRGYYGHQLRFFSITSHIYQPDIKRQISDVDPQTKVYEVFGQADVIVRSYTSQSKSSKLNNYLDERLEHITTISRFTVRSILRTWGFPVVTRIDPSILDQFDSTDFQEISRSWPNLETNYKHADSLILGRRKLPESSFIQGFMFISVQLDVDKKGDRIHKLANEIASDKALKSPVNGIYEGVSESGFGADILLEFSARGFDGVRKIQKRVYHLGQQLAIKTTTYFISEFVHDGDAAPLEESGITLFERLQRRFPGLAHLPGELALERASCLGPLMKWLSAPEPIGPWSSKAAQQIVSGDASGLAGTVADIARTLEKFLKKVLYTWATRYWGSQWEDVATKEVFSGDWSSKKATLGDLIRLGVKATQTDSDLKLPLELAAARHFNEVRNAIIHHTTDREPPRQREVPAALAGLFQQFDRSMWG